MRLADAPHDDEMSAETALWHPFAAMDSVRHEELVIVRSDDVWVWDSEDRRYLDATASLWYAGVGHGRTEIVEAVAEQMRRLPTYPIHNDLANEPALELAARLSRLAPMSGTKVFLGGGGADGVEAALKLARLYWLALGDAKRTHVISRAGGFHGTHGLGTSIGGIPANRTGYEPLVPNTSLVDADSVEALSREIDRIGQDAVCAFVFEPVLGAGGVYPPPPGYVEGVAAACRDAGVLLIVDATICGFGRLGTWFGIERWNVSPDMVIFGKGVTSGYLPLGGLLVSGRVAEPFWQPGSTVFRHGTTYAGHAACCAAALANMDILEREHLVGRGRELEGDLFDALAPLRAHPLVADVRGGLGLLAAVELDADLLARDPGAVMAVYRLARELGVIVRPLLRSVAVSPPLTVSGEHIGLIVEALRGALDALPAQSPRRRRRPAPA
jgi:adenosylmethionine-8-amino-7-oxononanoate aminotransferase